MREFAFVTVRHTTLFTETSRSLTAPTTTDFHTHRDFPLRFDMLSDCRYFCDGTYVILRGTHLCSTHVSSVALDCDRNLA